MKIFIVEDEPEMREIFSEWILDEGWEVETSESALTISPKPGDVVILDIEGTQSRNRSDYNTPFVITISGKARFGVALEKPFTKTDLVNAIEKKLNGIDAFALKKAK